jgi:hypothetical protein
MTRILFIAEKIYPSWNWPLKAGPARVCARQIAGLAPRRVWRDPPSTSPEISLVFPTNIKGGLAAAPWLKLPRAYRGGRPPPAPPEGRGTEPPIDPPPIEPPYPPLGAEGETVLRVEPLMPPLGRAPPICPLLTPMLVAGRAGACTRVVTAPCSLTCCETLPGSFKLPRGMPSPAEPPRTTILSLLRLANVEETTGPRFTIRVECPLMGACGVMKPPGAPFTTGKRLKPAQEFPGCHAQP